MWHTFLEIILCSESHFSKKLQKTNIFAWVVHQFCGLNEKILLFLGKNQTAWVLCAWCEQTQYDENIKFQYLIIDFLSLCLKPFNKSIHSLIYPLKFLFFCQKKNGRGLRGGGATRYHSLSKHYTPVKKFLTFI